MKEEKPPQLKVNRFFLKDFTSNFRSFSVHVNAFVAQSYFEKVVQQQMIIEYGNWCLLCIFDRQIADYKVQFETTSSV